MTLVLAGRPSTLDDLDLLIVDVAGSARTAGLSAAVADVLERRHFLRGVSSSTGTVPIDPSVAVVLTETSTVDSAVSVAARLEEHGIPSVLLAPEEAAQVSRSPDAGELWFVTAPEESTPLSAETLTAIELALCSNPYQIDGPAGGDGPSCDC